MNKGAAGRKSRRGAAPDAPAGAASGALQPDSDGFREAQTPCARTPRAYVVYASLGGHEGPAGDAAGSDPTGMRSVARLGDRTMADEGEILVLDTSDADESSVRAELELMYIILSKLMPILRIKDTRTGKPLTITELREDAIKIRSSDDFQAVVNEIRAETEENGDGDREAAQR